MCMREREEGWIPVRSRRDAKKSNVTTFFVSNIQAKVSTYMLWRACQVFGRVTDAFIPKKKNETGMKFGFVRFAGNLNTEKLLGNLNNISIGGGTIRVELAKFDRDKKRIIQEVKKNSSSWADQTGDNRQSNETKAGGMSYLNAVMKNNNHKPLAKELILNGEGALYPKYCVGRSIIGVAKDVKSLNGVKRMLTQTGKDNALVSYIGGLNVLITFNNKMEPKEFIASDRNIWGEVLDSATLWSGQENPRDRIIEINIYGVPLIWRDVNTYDLIGGLFGRVVESSCFSWSDENSDIGTVKILTSQLQTVDELILLRWRDRSFQVGVKEISKKFIPCFDPPSSADATLEEGEIGVEENSTPVNSPANIGKQQTCSNKEMETPRTKATGAHGEGENSLGKRTWKRKKAVDKIQINVEGGQPNETDFIGPNAPAFNSTIMGFNLGSGGDSIGSAGNRRRKRRKGGNSAIEHHSSSCSDQTRQPMNATFESSADNNSQEEGLNKSDLIVNNSEEEGLINTVQRETEDIITPGIERHKPPENSALEEEIRATIEIGNLLEINLQNHVEMVRDEVARDSAFSSDQ